MLGDQWRNWLEDGWYKDVVTYLLFKTLPANPVSNGRMGKIQRDSKHFALMDNATNKARLAHRESDGNMSFCVFRGQVAEILHRLHDNHGHFSVGIISRNI